LESALVEPASEPVMGLAEILLSIMFNLVFMAMSFQLLNETGVAVVVDVQDELIHKGILCLQSLPGSRNRSGDHPAINYQG
jgi:hypothetical protein